MNKENLAEELFQAFINNRSGSIKLKRVSDNFIEGEAGVLSYLTFVENNVTPGILSEKLNITSARVAKILKTLENKGYLKRLNDDVDKRKTIVRLNEEKRQNMINLKNDIIKHYTKVIEQLGEEDIKEFIRIVKKIDTISLKILKDEK